ncbi:hypothetical protein R9C00_24375 [Flammeovirgaceae bacterium SG7u.111]|nr:hypothetical protein [Flammeovirgaceae bacterium SG7u.132]WPO34839.1 hypothetical protein R9C00_24375 [Flammeovirgaceae bacterium SG7u.111]
MKKCNSFFFKSNQFISKTILAFAFGSLLFSCSEDSLDDTMIISEEEAAEVVIQSVEAESGGVVVQIEDASTMTVENIDNCGISMDTVISASSSTGATIVYEYTLSWDYALTCNNFTPQQFSFNYTGQASYDAPRIASADTRTGALTVEGLSFSSSKLLFNLEFVNQGSQTSKIGNKSSFTSTTTLKSADLAVDKLTYEILSGTVEVTISGATSTGTTFSYSGTLTFLGNRQGMLVMASGATYSIQW